MGGCAAANCSNHSRNGFRLYRFPRVEARRRKWIINCGRGAWVPGPGAQLCEVHFEKSQFEQNRADGLKKLKPNAVPTLFNGAERWTGVRPVIESVSSCTDQSQCQEDTVIPPQHIKQEPPDPEPYELPSSNVLLENIKTEVILPDEYNASLQKQYHTPEAMTSTSMSSTAVIPISQPSLPPVLPASTMVWNPQVVNSSHNGITTENGDESLNKKARIEPNNSEDRYDLFARNIACKLRDMNKTQHILVEKIINDALFEGEMGTLTLHHRLVDTSRFKESQRNMEV